MSFNLHLTKQSKEVIFSCKIQKLAQFSLAITGALKATSKKKLYNKLRSEALKKKGTGYLL